MNNNSTSLLIQLASKDWRERQEAIESLVRLDRLDLARSVLALMRQQHGNLNALSSALQVLEHIGRPLTGEFCALLTGPDRELRIYVPLLLGELGGPEAIQALIGAVTDRDQPENVRFNAIEALGKLRADTAVEPLLAILKEGSDFLRYAAVVALGEIGAPAVFPALLPLLQDARLSEPAVTALGQIDARLARLPESFYADAARALARWLEEPEAAGALAIQAGAALARSCPTPQRVQSEFLRALDERGRKRLLNLPAYEAAGLLEASHFCSDLALVLGWLVTDTGSDADRESAAPRESAAQEAAAREAAAQEAGMCFVRLLAFPQARSDAETALAQLPIATQSWLFNALVDLLRSSTDTDQCYAITRLLGGTASPAALPALRDMFESDDDILVAWAAQGFGKIAAAELAAAASTGTGPSAAQTIENDSAPETPGGEPETLGAVDLLWSGLEHRSSFVRRSAALALAGLKLPGMVERAEALLLRPDPRARESALRLLAELDEHRAALAALAALADPDANLRRVAAELLPRFSDPHIPAALEAALQSPDAGLRRAVAAVLPTAGAGTLGEENTRVLLLRAAGDEDGWVRTHALRGLGKLARPDDAEVLAHALADPLPPVRIAAVEGLARLLGQASDENQREAFYRRLLEMRSDPDAGVQRAVREALGEN